MKRILCCVSEWGYWGEELVAPVDILEAKGYTIDFMTPTGKKPKALTPSMTSGFFDPPLNKVVTSDHYAKRTRAFEDGDKLENTIDLGSWFPKRPYFNSQNFGRELEEYYKKRDECWEELKRYDALLMPGGSGAMVDMANNQQLHDVILGFYHQDKLIAAECYCVTCLAFARDWTERTSIIRNRHVTGHALEYDYKDGTGFVNIEGVNFGPPFYPLEYILRDAVAPNGKYHGGVGHERSTVLDYPFLTGRSTQDSELVGKLIVEVLEKSLRRYGW